MVSNGSQITSSETLSDALKPLFIVCGVYIALDVIFLIIRFTSRLLVRRSDLGWDGRYWYLHMFQHGSLTFETDWFLIPAFIFNIGACIIGIRKWICIPFNSVFFIPPHLDGNKPSSKLPILYMSNSI